ncbi:MAG: preprotein translocase subunit YajC [Deltaproteobacteria bacterium]|nr:preprotein translocase subunit YajC [Deltaproteobacteria bacterium]
MLLSALISTAHAADGAPAGPQSIFTSMLPLVIIFGIFYLLMIRPQQKQQKKHREMLGQLSKGDRVIMRSGMHGTVHGIADNVLTIEIAENVRVKFTRDAVASVEKTS